jgi:multidrug efflux system membrane fusion protein
VHTDQANIDTARLNQSYCRITAPVSGRVGIRLVDVGNYIQAGAATGIVVVTQMQPIDVLYTLPEDDLPAVLKSVKGGAEPKTDAFDRNNAVQLATGKLVAVDNQVAAATGTFKLRSEFDNANENLFPQQFVNVRLLVNTLHDAVLVPTAAVLKGATGSYVYLIKEGEAKDPGKETPKDGKDDAKPGDVISQGGPRLTVAARPVKVAETQGDTSAIASGLEAGDRIVVDGADKLHDGSEITIPEARPASQNGTDKPGAPDVKAPGDNSSPNTPPADNSWGQDGHRHHHHHHDSDGQNPSPSPAP